jgi:hypothetical protein
MSNPPPDRRTLRSTLIWSARWLLLGGNEQFRGPIKVTISSEDEIDERIIRDQVVTSDRVPTAFRQQSDAGLFEFLLNCFLSPEEKVVVRVLAESARKGAVLMDKSGLERSRFYTITANMIERGLIRKTDDGYELCDPLAVRAVEIAEKKEGAA